MEIEGLDKLSEGLQKVVQTGVNELNKGLDKVNSALSEGAEDSSIPVKCPGCGASLHPSTEAIIKCEYCGNEFNNTQSKTVVDKVLDFVSDQQKFAQEMVSQKATQKTETEIAKEAARAEAKIKAKAHLRVSRMISRILRLVFLLILVGFYLKNKESLDALLGPYVNMAIDQIKLFFNNVGQ